MENLYYSAKIWLAFGEAVNGNEKISGWLMKNGFPEVAALAYAIRGSEEATAWLFKNKFFHLAALDASIDENVQAYQWLITNKHTLLVVFADACFKDDQDAVNAEIALKKAGVEDICRI